MTFQDESATATNDAPMRRRVPEASAQTLSSTPNSPLCAATPTVRIRQASKEDNESLKNLVKETYTFENLLKPSIWHELVTPRKMPKFLILGYVVYVFTSSLLFAFLAAVLLLLKRISWTFLWIWLWPRLMIHDDTIHGGMVEKFRCTTAEGVGRVRRRRSCLLVAEVIGHGVVGCIAVAPGDSFINPTPTFFQKFAIWILSIDPPVAELKRLMVKRSHQNRGIASMLIKEALDFCVVNKYKSVTLSTFLVWHRARKLYVKFGFFESDIQMFDFSFLGKNLASK